MEHENLTRAKAWCFDNGVTVEEMETAWNNALKKDVMIIKNLHRHGHKWWWLAPHLLTQLHERYLNLEVQEQ